MFEPGEIVAIVGKNGSGKSTLIKIISGLLLQDSGSVDVLGVANSSRQIHRIVKFVLESGGGYYQYLSVKQNIEYFLHLNHLSYHACSHEISELFELLGDEFSSSIINALIKNIYSQRILIKEIVFAKIQTRILNFLNRIANADKIVELPFNIMTLASLLGAPRQNVSSAITKLVNDKKIVKLKGNRIKIL